MIQDGIVGAIQNNITEFMATLKQRIGDFFGYNEKIKSLESEKEKLLKDRFDLRNQLVVKGLEISTLNVKIKTLADSLNRANSLLKPTDVPTANITYERPVLVGKDTWEFVQIDVRNFIMPDFETEQMVNKSSLVFDGTQDLDTLIPKVYLLAKKGYGYGSDTNFGFSEYWMFPFELKHVLKKQKAGDCEDWAILIGSFFEAAKIPSSNWLVSAGFTRNGIGHATVYAKDSTDVWRHLNSTSPSHSFTDLKDYPSNKDETDSIGIKEGGFWLSFNKDFSLHEFETKEASDSFKKENLPIRIKAKKDA